jgi:hypothetical protein
MTNLRIGLGLDEIIRFIEDRGGLGGHNSAPQIDNVSFQIAQFRAY